MKISNKLSSLVLTIILISIIALLFVNAGKTDPPNLPGITTKDQYPNGCVDCHKSEKGRDFRLNTTVNKIKRHPNIDKIVKSVPADCNNCHSKGKVPALNAIVHKQHYEKPESNTFVTSFDGACLHCHALNMQKGEVRNKDGAKNW